MAWNSLSNPARPQTLSNPPASASGVLPQEEADLVAVMVEAGGRWQGSMNILTGWGQEAVSKPHLFQLSPAAQRARLMTLMSRRDPSRQVSREMMNEGQQTSDGCGQQALEGSHGQHRSSSGGAMQLMDRGPRVSLQDQVSRRHSTSPLLSSPLAQGTKLTVRCISHLEFRCKQ